MTTLFRIETEQTELTWAPQESDVAPTLPEGRLAITLAAQTPKSIKVSREGVPDEISSDLRVEVGPILHEETSYNFLLHSAKNARVELRHRDPVILQGLQSLQDGSIVHGSINFKSQIGRSKFSVYVDGKPEYDFEVEVFPSKLDYAADYEVLVADLQDFMAGLVLEYLRSTYKLGFATDSENPSRLEWIFLLRHIIEDLERGVHYIERYPHHDLTRKRIPTRIEKLRRPDATISKLVAQGKGAGATSRTASGIELHSRLPEHRARMTWDTPEHRWLSAQLSRIRQILAEILVAERKSGSNKTSRQARVVEELTDLENRVAALQSLGPIANAKGFAPAEFASIILQAKPGYREAYRACLMLLQGLRVDGGPVGLSVKDIHLLYEYWCYLTLVRLVAKIIGEPIPVRQLFSVVQHGLQVRLKRGVSHTVKFPNNSRTIELTYNPKYKGDAFVLPQEPDVVLTLRDAQWPIMRFVFDAKYRINTEPGYVKQFGSPGPPQSSIDALHRYRDAILEETGSQGPRSECLKHTVVECVALFPYVDVENKFRSSHFWSRLEGVGIGAIPFLPRETRYVEEWLRGALQRGGWATAERVIPYLSHEQLHA